MRDLACATTVNWAAAIWACAWPIGTVTINPNATAPNAWATRTNTGGCANPWCTNPDPRRNPDPGRTNARARQNANPRRTNIDRARHATNRNARACAIHHLRLNALDMHCDTKGRRY
jgi:predicted deacylase